jgi:phenylacetate-CoA ligase
MQPPFDAWRSCTVAADVALATHANRAALSARRAQRLANLLAAAVRGSALYRKVLKGRTLADVQLQQLPVVHKRDLMNHFDEWVTDPELRLAGLRRFTGDPARVAEPYLGRYVVWESSGSSGEPGIFVQDAQAMAVYDALEALRRPAQPPWQRLLDPWGLRERIAFVGAIGGHFASAVSVERLRRLNPMLAASLRSVSFLQPAHQLVAELDALAPTVITTYPSAAVLLAGERLAGRLKCSPREVWTGGETLTPSMREFVQRAFACRVINSYGASEFLSLACECAHGSLHLNSDWATLESVDERGQPVPDGEAGFATLLTNFANHVQPLIRYDIGDRVTLHAQPCACGSMLPVIEVEGRSDDTLRLGASGTATVCVLPLAISTVLEDDADLFDFQLVQQGPCTLLLRTAMRGAEATATLRRARTVLAAFLSGQGAEGLRIHCHTGEPSQRGRSGKVARVLALPA